MLPIIPGYQTIAQIYESVHSLVYRAIRPKDGQPVILKFLKEDSPSPQELTRYKQEYDITRSLKIEGVINVYSLEEHQHNLIIILEDFGAISFRDWVNSRAISLDDLLSYFISIADILGNIHASNIIHKDINPSNIVINPSTGILKIIDFGISTQLSRENPTLKNPNILEGTLAYISPEQTGRMNRALDYRTDFYSLGVTFYELLTGRLPFETTDALELVHCHIAKQPILPHEVNPELPLIISEIVMKLMAKTAEERYKSAFGLKADLEICLSQLQESGQIVSFLLATKDISDKFQIPQKLYGRSQEVETLLSAFERTSKGPTELMLVAGYSGIGKSALVNEVHKPITQKRGYFISGKFDQFQRNIPYSAVVAAFDGLVRQLLTENDEELKKWREKILTFLGSNAQVIIDVIPNVELIIGPQPQVSELGAMEAQNRFNLVFQNFIRAFCSLEHPLVIFLDDLQWADSASLKLMELMMRDNNTHYLFLIGAYRDNEVTPTHPLMMILEGLRGQNVTINQITLSPLQPEHICQLIADTVHSNIDSVKSLAELVNQKTGGNPFFVNEFLKTLYTESLFTFDFERLIWLWNIPQIEAKGITDNVVELMIAKLKKLPVLTQKVLSLSACVGATFSLNTLSIVSKKSRKELFKDLEPALQSGLILPLSELDADLLIEDYQFLHDRVQQGAYALMDEDEKTAIHLQIGRMLLAHISEDTRSENLFEIVDHLNQSRVLIIDETEKIELATLNLEAGIKAKDATAYAAAQEYLFAGRQCLNSTSWLEYYDLTLDLYLQLANVEFLIGNFEASQDLIALILTQVKTPLEKAEVYNLLLVQYTMMAKYNDVIETGRKALNELGIDLPDSELEAALQVELAQAQENLRDREIASLINAPEITIPEQKLTIKLLSSIDPAAYFGNQKLYGVIVVKMAQFSLKYGHISESSKAYVTYGMILGSILGDYQSGYEFGCLAVALSEKFKSPYQKCSACLVLGGHLNHWLKHIKYAENLLSDSYHTGMESGEFRHAGYALEHQLRYLFYQGKNLDNLKDTLQNYLLFNQNIKNTWATDGILGFQLAFLNLTGMTSGKLDFNNGEINEQQFLEQCLEHNSFAWLCTFNIFKGQILYLYGYLDEALTCIGEAQKWLSYILGQFQNSEYNFHSSLIWAGIYSQSSPAQQTEYWQRLENNQKQMKIWADNSPDNFEHKYLLIAAEMAQIEGHILDAMSLYDRAILSARQNDFIQNEALANELAAKFWLRQGKDDFAKIYLKKAFYCYQIWGAKRKVEDLQEKYPLLLKSSSVNSVTTTRTSTRVTSTGTNASIAFDFATVMKASLAISGEIVLEQLLTALMKILIECAGAEIGHLILEIQGKLLIETSGGIDDQQITVLQSIPIDGNLPVSIINYVARTQETVVLDHATSQGDFTNDPYITRHQPKSILCVPLINQAQLVSIVYFENNLAIAAFTPERIEVLKVLSAQAAISIENARLYQTLEDKVKERTLQLAEANQEIMVLNEKLKEENVRMSAELDIAKKLQEMILPKPLELESIEGLEISGFMEPADEIGGDYYDVLKSGSHVKIAIGDVTGHGLESGILMLMAQTAVRTLLEGNFADPQAFLDVLNRTIYQNAQRMNTEKSMTLALLDYSQGKLQLSGQHEEVIIVRANGECELLDTVDLGFPIALVDDISDFVSSTQVQLHSGDVVVLYTDGITEAININQELYGLERLIDIVKLHYQCSTHEIKEAVINDIRQHIGTQKVYDDITLVVLKQI